MKSATTGLRFGQSYPGPARAHQVCSMGLIKDRLVLSGDATEIFATAFFRNQKIQVNQNQKWTRTKIGRRKTKNLTKK
ncbi:MAG TPA: hypothetical protein VE135_17030 [Pyrinomonadaceae bacterium]|nr:hypothetical protein [Pyrinomonadaceae bacterium]